MAFLLHLSHTGHTQQVFQVHPSATAAERQKGYHQVGPLPSGRDLQRIGAVIRGNSPLRHLWRRSISSLASKHPLHCCIDVAVYVPGLVHYVLNAAPRLLICEMPQLGMSPNPLPLPLTTVLLVGAAESGSI